MSERGVTLTEILIVVAILVILSLMLIGGMNFTANVDKAGDAQRKSDLNRIKISFEDYFNDEGCYPNQGLVNSLMSSENCGASEVFAPWLDPWLCDGQEPYQILVEDEVCPSWFIVLTNLRNKNDRGLGICGFEGCPVMRIDPPIIANYGVSSDNLLWYTLNVECNLDCYQMTDGACNMASGGCTSNCYTGDPDYPCHPACAVDSCGGL
jgi:prepilin-type N-terminal cleavage/methylation domain-containing protein